MDDLIASRRDGLLNDTVPFWLRHGLDREHGGVCTCVDRDGTIVDTDKGIWQQGRFAWLMAKLYNTVERRPEWLGAARDACQFLDDFGFDPADGRMWFHVTREGRPLRKRRYAFSEAFAAMAFGELALATGEERWADRSRECFGAYVRQITLPNPANPKFTATRPAKSLGYPMIALNVAQELRAAIDLPSAQRWADWALEEIEGSFVKPDIECVMETVAPDGSLIDHFDGRMLNPGHAIEAAWFVMREGFHRGDQQAIDLGRRMLDWMWRRGWDEEFGGLFYFRDVRDLPVQEYWHDMKFWWPHCEAAIATALAYRATRDADYLAKHRLVLDWCERHLADPEHGEWFGYAHRDGRLSVTLKGNLWKGPFHLPRMQLVCWRELQALAERDAAEP